MHRKNIFTYIFIICILYYFYLQYQVVTNENSFKPEKSDAIIILGHALENGKTPGEWLIKRLQTGLELYEEGYAEYIVVTGGEGFFDRIPVAVAMKQWLVDSGVSELDIIVEDESKNTNENFKFTKNDNNQIDSILVVTNDFHMYRSMMIASHYFSDVSGKSANIEFGFDKLIAYLKEPLSIIKVLLDIRLLS